MRRLLGDGSVIEARGAGAAAARVENELPEDLFAAMKAFLAAHPEGSQPRLMQAALSGLLFQQSCKEAGVNLRRFLDGGEPGAQGA